jgi:hypothetical protein
MSRIYKLLTSKSEEQIIPINKWANELIDSTPKKKYK